MYLIQSFQRFVLSCQKRFVDFAIEIAMRRGEIARTSGGQRVDGGLLIEDDKTGKTIVIPLSNRAVEIFNKYPKGFDRQPDSITQEFNRAKE